MGVGDSICPNLKLPLKQSRLPFAVGMHCGVALVFEGCISPGLAAPDPFTGLAWAPGFVDLFRELASRASSGCGGETMLSWAKTGNWDPSSTWWRPWVWKAQLRLFWCTLLQAMAKIGKLSAADGHEPRKSRCQASLVQRRYVAEPRWGAHPVRLSGDFSARDANQTARAFGRGSPRPRPATARGAAQAPGP